MATVAASPPRAALLPEGTYRQYIDGTWTDSASGRHKEVIDPATAEPIASVPFGDRVDTAQALTAAGRAMPAWAAATAYERGQFLLRIAGLMRERIEPMARALTMEEGKTLAEARGELAGAAAQFEWYAEEGKRVYGEIIPTHVANKRLWTTRQPVGVVGSMAAWNFSVLLQARKIAPALAAGCTVVSRPSAGTPLATMLLFGCMADAGLPPGVANLVTGPASEVAAELMENPICRKISFTGSTAVGKELIRQSSDQVKKLSLELGGHAPMIVFDDVSVEQAVRLAVTGKFRNMGQVCISPSRFYVHENIIDAFTAETVRLTQALRLGDGLADGTDVGPLFELERVERTEALIADARDRGGRVVCGGSRPTDPALAKGYFFEPTVMVDVGDDALISSEEAFAPILPVYPFASADDAIARANDTPYGLAAYVQTRDIATMVRTTEALDYGIIGVNEVVPATAQAPFGGMKQSGVGREGGKEGINAYLETKYMSMSI
jgi:succinate-semialdehyde dehydrogenase / glutarate-semialdehyde dehydrogenase